MHIEASEPYVANRAAIEAGQSKIEMAQERLIKRFAAAKARLDGSHEVFRDGEDEDAREDDRMLRQDYLDEARDLLQDTCIFDNLALVEIYLRKTLKPKDGSLCLDAIESFIAQRMSEVESVRYQLEASKSGYRSLKDEDWSNRAYFFLEKTLKDISFGHKLRLRAMRESDMKELASTLVSGRDREIARLLEINRREKVTRIRVTDRCEAQMQALMSLIGERAPHLLEDAHTTRDAAALAFDAKIATQEIGGSST